MIYENYLDSLNSLGSKPGLDSIKELLNRLGNPQNELNCIHIAGTNGKGSVGAFIDKILTLSGYTTGRYSSPAVIEPLEIIRINEKNIEENAFNKIVVKVKEKCDEMLKDGLTQPTRFEVETASAILYFYEQKVDFAIIECGMGGLLDATNVFDNVLCSVITAISLEHTAFLGNTIKDIATQKAGIIKNNCPVTTSNTGEALEIIKSIAITKNAEIHTIKLISDINISDTLQFSYGRFKNINSGLLGIYQTENAALAIETIDVIKNKGYSINDDAVIRGILATKWEGRFEVIHRNPDFIIDGAHNPAGAKALADSLRAFYPNKKLIFLIGIFKDKDIYGILDEVIDFAKEIVLIETPNNVRAMNSEALAKMIYDRYGLVVRCATSVDDGVDKCIDIAETDDTVIAFGSLSNLKRIKEKVYNIC